RALPLDGVRVDTALVCDIVEAMSALHLVLEAVEYENQFPRLPVRRRCRHSVRAALEPIGDGGRVQCRLTNHIASGDTCAPPCHLRQRVDAQDGRTPSRISVAVRSY